MTFSPSVVETLNYFSSPLFRSGGGCVVVGTDGKTVHFQKKYTDPGKKVRVEGPPPLSRLASFSHKQWRYRTYSVFLLWSAERTQVCGKTVFFCEGSARCGWVQVVEILLINKKKTQFRTVLMLCCRSGVIVLPYTVLYLHLYLRKHTHCVGISSTKELGGGRGRIGGDANPWKEIRVTQGSVFCARSPFLRTLRSIWFSFCALSCLALTLLSVLFKESPPAHITVRVLFETLSWFWISFLATRKD